MTQEDAGSAPMLGSVAYSPAWGQDDFSEMDADELAIRSILSRCFSLGRRHRWTQGQFAESVERKRAKINAIIDKYKEQAEKGRQTL